MITHPSPTSQASFSIALSCFAWGPTMRRTSVPSGTADAAEGASFGAAPNPPPPVDFVFFCFASSTMICPLKSASHFFFALPACVPSANATTVVSSSAVPRNISVTSRASSLSETFPSSLVTRGILASDFFFSPSTPKPLAYGNSMSMRDLRPDSAAWIASRSWSMLSLTFRGTCFAMEIAVPRCGLCTRGARHAGEFTENAGRRIDWSIAEGTGHHAPAPPMRRRPRW
mmetsp:Transcript_56902/g.134330  ORF Transcript_56902/g.134330 Transcript_56902/m.134330 type:complete len:229 (+) Transcript_56902:151-837(+)